MLGIIAIATLLGAAISSDEPIADDIGRALSMVDELKKKIVESDGGSLEEDQEFFLSDWVVSDESKRWWENKTNTKWLDEGTSRIAVQLKDGRVLKIALDREGQKANLAELKTWNDAQGDAEVLDFLVPIHGGNENFIVMDYAEPLGYIDENDPIYRERQQAWGKILQEGRSRAMDVPYFNWGIHRGKMKLLDYEEWE